MRFSVVVLAAALLAVVSYAHECQGGEYRRSHDCATVKHQKSGICCWMRRDGSHGRLPVECCGTGWTSEDCAAKVEDICSNPDHHDNPHAPIEEEVEEMADDDRAEL